MKRLHKTIRTENGDISIYGSNRPIILRLAIPEFNRKGSDENDMEQYFVFEGRRRYLSEFVVPSGYSPLKDFDGILNDTFFSGIVIKLCTNQYGDNCVRAFLYTS